MLIIGKAAMSDSELKQFLKNIAAAKSETRLQSLADEQLDEYLEYFIDIRPHLTHPWMVRDYEDRIKALRKEKDRRFRQRQHDEAIGVAKQNVKWTKIVGILALIAAVGVPLMIQYCSLYSSMIAAVIFTTATTRNTAAIGDRHTITVRAH